MLTPLKNTEVLNVKKLDALSFGSAKPDATKEILELAKDTFVKMDKFNSTNIDEKEMESFAEFAKSVFDKIRAKVGLLQEAKLPNRSVSVDTIGDTDLHAYSYNVWRGSLACFFEQHSKDDTKMLKGLEIAPSFNHISLYSTLDGTGNIRKTAKGPLNKDGSPIEIIYETLSAAPGGKDTKSINLLG